MLRVRLAGASTQLPRTPPAPVQAALALKLLTAEEFDQWVRPETMIAPKD